MRGGIPKIDTHIQLSLISGKTTPITIDRGTKNFSARGEIKEYNGNHQISYNGKQAWKKSVEINGTLSFLTDPLANEKEITIYMNEIFRNVAFSPKRIEKDHQFVVNRLEWSQTNFKNSLDIYDCTQPGFNNLSRFRNFPWALSLPYFKEGSQISNIVPTSAPFLNKVFVESVFGNRKFTNDWSQERTPYLRIERFSGFVFDFKIPLLVTPI